MRNENMKGIILAGGLGSRLYPATKSISKQLLPIYDKPTIYYPLTTLMKFGIKDILIITNPEYINQYGNLLGNGRQWGITISYKAQENPNGIPEAFILGEDFIGNAEQVALILGDNIFHTDLAFYGCRPTPYGKRAAIFVYKVQDPQRYGVLDFKKDETGYETPIRIIEKPEKPPSLWAVTGLYMYDHSVIKYAKSLKRSERGELEITDLNQLYLDYGYMTVHYMNQGAAWFDSGTPDSLMEAAQYIQAMQKRQGTLLGSPELIAHKKGFIDDRGLESCLWYSPSNTSKQRLSNDYYNELHKYYSNLS